MPDQSLHTRRVLRDATGRAGRHDGGQFRFADPTGARHDHGLPRSSAFVRQARRRKRATVLTVLIVSAAALTGLAVWGYWLGQAVILFANSL